MSRAIRLGGVTILVLAVAVLIGCSGGFGPTLPSPDDDEGDVAPSASRSQPFETAIGADDNVGGVAPANSASLQNPLSTTAAAARAK